MVSLNRIRFGGVFSNELNMPDLIMDCAFDSDSSEVSTFLTREAVASESYDGRNRRISSFKYTENFAPKFTFIKKEFGDFTQEEIRTLLKYLTSKDITGLLEAYDDDSNVVSWASIGNFSEIQLYKTANKRVVGVTAVWNSISPFALSDLHSITKIIANPINTTMYLWTPTAQTGTVPSYFLTSKSTVTTGDKLYTFTGEASTVINKDIVSLYNTVNDKQDSTYIISDATFTLSTSTMVTVQDANNKITIEIDTDDNKPVYPRILIQQNGSVVNIPSGTVLTYLSDMVENTVYFNGATYYWKTENSEDPIYFHSSAEDPNLSTTSVKFTNTHTDFFNQQTVLNPTIVKNNNLTEIVIIDGANKIISSNSVRRIFGNDFNLQYIELHDGKNEIVIEGNCKVTIEWRETRKTGDY